MGTIPRHIMFRPSAMITMYLLHYLAERLYVHGASAERITPPQPHVDMRATEGNKSEHRTNPFPLGDWYLATPVAQHQCLFR